MNIRVADGNMRIFETKSILFPGNLSFLLFGSIKKKKEIRECWYRTPLNIAWMIFLFRFVLGFNVFVGHYILINGLASTNSIRIETFELPQRWMSLLWKLHYFLSFHIVYSYNVNIHSIFTVHCSLFTLETFYEPQLLDHVSTRLLRALFERKTIW